MANSVFDLIPLSKSQANRNLILKACEGASVFHDYAKYLENEYQPLPLDVVELISCLRDFFSGCREFKVDDGGTSFRFFACFLSRHPGRYLLQLGPALAARPHEMLKLALEQLRTQMIWEPASSAFRLEVQGWQSGPIALQVMAGQSSQVLSGLVLAAHRNESSVELVLGDHHNAVSWDFVQMTLAQCGLAVAKPTESLLIVPQKYSPHYALEKDVSSAVVFLARDELYAQESLLKSCWSANCMQPDYIFLKILEDLKQDICEWDLVGAPDLAPVLSVLLALKGGHYKLHGLQHLKHKESNRQEKISQLLARMSVQAEWIQGSLHINSPKELVVAKGTFDPERDHRLVMACALANSFGHELEILNPHCVDKSFPQFWQAWNL
jgi:3-phosphoshikimate 1-carboxyvinyltransferase